LKHPGPTVTKRVSTSVSPAAARAGSGDGTHAPRKRFGQHFLVDDTVIEAIVQRVMPRAGQIMVEIGPGLGALTQPLVERLGHLVVVELDRDLAARLRDRADLTVVQADVLTVDFSRLLVSLRSTFPHAMAGPGVASETRRLRVVGNLPYNISTPILFHLLDHAEAIEDQHFMLQKEVVERMVAAPDTAAYGRLSVMLQWRYEMDNFLPVPPESFAPPPRVDSAVVSMRPRTAVQVVDAALLSTIVRVAFSQRRKLLRHTLGRWLDERVYAGEFDLQRRAQEVPVHEYLALAASAAA
jgi:16S rRNA (adenine1518-N6/adenine1519-N6)-dimethyltransferase